MTKFVLNSGFHNKGLTLALALSLATVACGDLLGGGDGGNTVGDGSVTKDTGGGQPDVGAPPAGLVTFKNAGDSAEASFTSGSEQYLVLPYSVSSTAADSIGFDITVSAGGSTTSTSHALRTSRRPLRERNPALWARWERRLKVERWTRDQAVKAAASRLTPVPGGMTRPMSAGCTLSSECKDSEVCHNQACVTSVTLNVSEFSSTKSVKAAVKLKGTRAAVLVDENDTVSAANLQGILDKFQKVIYPRDTGLFGNPPLSSSGSTLASDRNKDGLVWLVLTNEVSDKLSAVGFFNAVDFSESSANSNKADILYIESDSAAKLADVYPILAHEFQHLLNFASKKYKPEAAGGTGALEALWLDEGQSHFAEDACGYGGENVTLLDQELFTSFGDFAAISAKDSKGMRAMALLYVRYLFEQKGGVSYASDGSVTDKGGAAFLKGLHTTSKQGTAAVDAAFGDYKKVFDTFMAAVALDGRNVTTYPRYIYQPLVTDPVTGASIGMKIRGSRKDNTGATVTLQGPLEDTLGASANDSVANASGKLFLLKGKTGKVTVKVTSTASDFRFALIKLK